MSSIAPQGVQTGCQNDAATRFSAVSRVTEAVEHWLDSQRDRLPLWLPVALGGGIAAWFTLPTPGLWRAALLGLLALACVGVVLGGRFGRCLVAVGVMAALGLGLTWARADRVAAPRLERPVVAVVTGRVVRVERLAEQGAVRLTLAQAGPDGVPPTVRVSVAGALPAGIVPGARISVRARLMPPPPPSAPGGYDFQRRSWFMGLGASGRVIGAVTLTAPAAEDGWQLALARLRDRLTRHVTTTVGGGEGGIAAALLTGDQSGVPEAIAQPLRDAGLAHLLSISGLHVAAVIGFAMLATRRLLALSPWLALNWPLMLIAAGAGALAGIGYTLLAGSEVPTVRSCIAALVVLAGLALGREAISLRTVAIGAFLILLVRPEALIGPSFQLSFAAVVAIICLYESPRLKPLFTPREAPWWDRTLRHLAVLLITGLAVEAALAPIALFHFNRTGIYGALANIIAIPLTTFVIMPLEALALLADLFGLGAPLWWLLNRAVGLLIALAATVAGWPAATALLPTMPTLAFGAMVVGGLWLALWTGRVRWLGLIALAAGAGQALAHRPPDLLITGDGRHVGVRDASGRLGLLRVGAGDFTRDMLGDAAGSRYVRALDDAPGARCSPDLCVVTVAADGRRWRIAATRTPYFIDRPLFEPVCRDTDIMISDRRLPAWCQPRWLKLDRPALAETGAVAIRLSPPGVDSVAARNGRHPWADPRR